MSAKRTSGAVMTSLIVHGVVFVIAGIYLVTQTQQFRDRFGAEVLQAKEPPKPQVRKPVITTNQANSSNYKYNGC